MKKLSAIARYIVEKAANGPIAGESLGDSDIAGLGKDPTIFKNVVVKNPAGKGFASPNSGFGFGLGMDDMTSIFIQDFIRANVADEDKFVKNPETGEDEERFPDTDDPSLPDWQQVNRAVGNYVRTKIDQVLMPMKLGRVAKNPASRYDGMDMTKIGMIVDKKGRTPKIKFKTF